MIPAEQKDSMAQTVLVVDDTSANIGVVAQNLEQHGYRVLAAQDGEEALRRAELAQPDLILLDVMMPVLDGYEVCRRLKKQAITRDIPVIFMTARTDTEDKLAAFKVGAVDYVVKPLQIEEVIARVQTQLELSSMQKRLEKQNAQLQRYREQLEQRVAERTAELSETNYRLRNEVVERKRAQQEVERREREFRTLAENLPDNLARYDLQGRTTYMNPHLLKLTDRTMEAAAGKTPLEANPGPMMAEYQALLMQTLATGEPAEFELEFNKPAGQTQLHYIRFVAEFSATGEITGALAIGRDITELRLADAALRERELRYRQLFENSPISIWEEDFSAVHSYFDELRQAGVEDLGAYFDAHPEAVGHCAELARIVDVNQAAVTLHRAQSKAELFAGLQQTFTPDSFRAFREELIGLWCGETEMKVDATVQTLAGEPRHVAVHFSIVPDTDAPWSKALVSLVDITERKRAEQELAMLGAAIAKMHEAAYFIDDEARIFYVNDEASRQLGYSRDEFLGMTVMDIAPGWTRDMVVNAWQGLGENEAVTFEAEHRRKDGGIVPVEINATHLTHDGKAFGLAMVRDITERKRAERELHLLNYALDNAFDATYLIDDDMHLRYVNEAAARALGYSREELLSMTLPDIDPNLKPEMLKAVMAHTSALGRLPGILETQHRRKDGTVFPIDVGATVFDYEGERLHLTTVRDITERKKAEAELANYREHLEDLVHERTEALQERESRLRALAESSPGMMGSFRMRPDGSFCMPYVSPNIFELFGVHPEELAEDASPLLQLNHPDDAQRVRESIAESARTMTPWRCEYRIIHPQKGLRWMEGHTNPFPHPEGGVVWYGYVHDITERMNAEQRLKEALEFTEGVINAIPDLLFEVNAEGRYLNVWTQSPELLAAQREQLLGKTVKEVLSPENAALALKAIREAGEKGTSLIEDICIDLPQGKHWFSHSLSRKPGGAPGESTFLVLSRDVTERKQMEKAIAEREREFRSLAEGSPDVIVRYDHECRRVYTNHAATFLSGKPVEAMLGHTPDDGSILRGSYIDKLKTGIQRVFASGNSERIEMEVIYPDGSAHDFDSLLVPQMGTDGQVETVLNLARDITERKKMEAALQESEARYRYHFNQLQSMLESAASVSVFALDREYRYLFFNNRHREGAKRLRGTDIEIGMNMVETMPDPEFREFCRKGFDRVLAGNVVSVESKEKVVKDGVTSYEYNDNFGSPIFNDVGEVIGLTVFAINTTERKKMGAALQESEARYRYNYNLLQSIIESPSDSVAIYAIDREYRLLAFNSRFRSAAKRLWNSEIELGMSVLDAIDTEAHREVFRQGAIPVLAGKHGFLESQEDRIEDGKIVREYHDNYGSPIYDDNGDVVGMTIFVLTTTERKEAELKLKASLEFTEGIINAIPDLLFEMDGNGRYLNIWTHTPELLAEQKELLLGKTVHDMLAPDSAATVMDALREARENGASFGKVIHSDLPQGTVWFELSASRLTGSDTAEMRFLVLSRDVTARRHAEDEIRRLNADLEQRVLERTLELEDKNKALSESEQRYREIFDNAVEGIYLLEVTKDNCFRNVDINPALAASVGIPREAMIGKYVDDGVPEEVGRLVVEKYRRCVAAGKTTTEEIELDLPTGKRVYYSTITPIYHGKKVNRLIGISRDITALKKTERELQESRELLRGLSASREAAREEERKHIAREVHDELGQILTGLQLNVSVLEHKFSPNLPDLKAHLKDTRGLTDRALAVTRNVASSLRPAALDMGVQSALEWLVSRFSANTGILCKIQFKDDELQLDESQSVALFRIVQESLTNVSRHAQATRVNISFGLEDGEYVLRIKDNGKGFNAETRKSGSFGLVGIQERALMLGGKAEIKSKPRQGTEIEIRIPVNSKEVKS